jgi:hypothetical protein
VYQDDLDTHLNIKLMKTHQIMAKCLLLLLVGLVARNGSAQGLTTKLVACYDMDCNTLNGTGNTSLNGVIQGNVTCAPGHSGNNSYQFGGTTADYIELPNSPLLKPNDIITVSGWYYITSMNGQMLVFSKNNCQVFFGSYSLYFGNGFFIAGIDVNCAANNLNSGWAGTAINTWHFVVFTVSTVQNNSFVRLSVNGNPWTTITHSFPFNYDPAATIILGGTKQPNYNPPFLGRMDNVRFWNRSLSMAEVLELYNNDPPCNSPGSLCKPAGPIHSWDFSGNLLDGMGMNNGTWQGPNNALYVTDHCGATNSAIRLNGSQDYVQMPAGGPVGTSARSVSFWMRTTNTTFGGSNVVRTPYSYGDPAINQTAGTRFEVCHNYNCASIGTDVSMQYIARPDACINDGNWHHIVVTAAAGAAVGGVNVYRDGVAIQPNCSNSAFTAILNSPTAPTIIGALLNNSSPTRFFDGDLDDIDVYDRALTVPEVVDLYTCKCGTKLSFTGPTLVCDGQTYTYNYTGPALSGLVFWLMPQGWTIVNSNNTSVTLIAGPPGSGHIQMVHMQGCTTQVGILSVVSKDCCNNALPGYSVLTSINPNQPIAAGSYIIPNNLVLPSNVTFANSEFLMKPNVQITIPSGKVLTLDHSHLYSCGPSRWQGIVVQDGGQLVASNLNQESSLIEDANIAVDVSNITSAHANPPLNLENVIFNKNYISINITSPNSGLVAIPFRIVSCVFTSRSMPFASPSPFNSTSWPSSGTAVTALRYAAPGATGGLASPYPLLNYPSISIKGSPHPGYIGIKIEDVDNVVGGPPNTGVDIGLTFLTAPGQFNLFDRLGEGIRIKNGSLSTYNNVFQDMHVFAIPLSSPSQGLGIYSEVSTTMNAKLDLKPWGMVNQNTNCSNRFWNCGAGVVTSGAYNVEIEYGIFRSDKVGLASPTGKGHKGIRLSSNRFLYDIKYCEFNNIHDNIRMLFSTGNYNMGSGNVVGTYANNVVVNENYIGPEVSSNTTLGSHYSNDAIYMQGNPTGWNIVGTCDIIANKIDRVFHGITSINTDYWDVEIGGNEILMLDDNLVANWMDQSGIYARNSLGNLFINQNNVTGQGTGNTRMKLIRSDWNIGGRVNRNVVANGYKGFVFENMHRPGAEWLCNRCMHPMTYGFSLESMGEIGQQGSAQLESGNEFLPACLWIPPSFFTYCDGSSFPMNSQLWVRTYQCNPMPVHVGIMPNQYVNGGWNNPQSFNTVFDPNSNFTNDCIGATNYPTPPSWRSGTPAINTGLLTEANEWKSVIYPNPSNGRIYIKTQTSSENLRITVTDVTGKVLFDEKITSYAGVAQLDLQLSKAAYFMRIVNEEGKVSREKILISE